MGVRVVDIAVEGGIDRRAAVVFRVGVIVVEADAVHVKVCPRRVGGQIHHILQHQLLPHRVQVPLPLVDGDVIPHRVGENLLPVRADHRIAAGIQLGQLGAGFVAPHCGACRGLQAVPGCVVVIFLLREARIL